MSDIESEFELEMDDLEVEDSEIEFGTEGDSEGEFGSGSEDLADRLIGLASREFESEYELNDAVNEVTDELEREDFLGKFGKKLGSWAKKAAPRVLGNLPIAKLAKSFLPGLNLKSLLGNVLKSVMASNPALAALAPAAGPALQALGFKEVEDPEENREAWNRFLEVSQDAYEYMVQNLTPQSNEPLQANKLAAAALHHGMSKARSRRTGGGNRRKHVVRVSRGDVVVIKIV
jgi:hypothetical protein